MKRNGLWGERGEPGILATGSAVGPDNSVTLPRTVDLRPESFHSCGDARFLADSLVDPLDRVEDRGVITVAVETTDLGEREGSHLPGQVDGDVSCCCCVSVAPSGLKGFVVGVVVGGDGVPDQFRSDCDV